MRKRGKSFIFVGFTGLGVTALLNVLTYFLTTQQTIWWYFYIPWALFILIGIVGAMRRNKFQQYQ